MVARIVAPAPAVEAAEDVEVDGDFSAAREAFVEARTRAAEAEARMAAASGFHTASDLARLARLEREKAAELERLLGRTYNG